MQRRSVVLPYGVEVCRKMMPSSSMAMWPLSHVPQLQRCQGPPGTVTSMLWSFSQAADINVQDAVKVMPNTREAPLRSRLAKATCLLTNRTQIPQPTSNSAATGVAPHLREMGGEKTSAMAEGIAPERRPRRELDEGV